jgi:hypothetical protein
MKITRSLIVLAGMAVLATGCGSSSSTSSAVAKSAATPKATDSSVCKTGIGALLPVLPSFNSVAVNTASFRGCKWTGSKAVLGVLLYAKAADVPTGDTASARVASQLGLKIAAYSSTTLDSRTSNGKATVALLAYNGAAAIPSDALGSIESAASSAH